MKESERSSYNNPDFWKELEKQVPKRNSKSVKSVNKKRSLPTAYEGGEKDEFLSKIG